MPIVNKIRNCSFQGVKRLESNNIYDTQSGQLPAPSVTNGPIPYYPELKKLVPNVTSAILVAYFEMRFPAPEDTLTRIASLPVTIPMDTVADALQISRRTLSISLYSIARVYPSEDRRSGAARVAREFLMPNHHPRFGKFKLYSIVCNGNLECASTITLRRNQPLITSTFPTRGVPTTSGDLQQASANLTRQLHESASAKLSKMSEARALTSTSVGLAEVLLRGSELAGDRRRTRYDRERKAGGKPAKKRNTTLTKPNHGVEPKLPEEVTGRLLHLRDGDFGRAEGSDEG